MIEFAKTEIKLYLQYGNGGNSVNVSNKRNGATDELRCHNSTRQSSFIKENQTWM